MGSSDRFLSDEYVCPSWHPHSENCYRKHKCRCSDCRAVIAARARERHWRLNPDAKPLPPNVLKPCACGCGTQVVRRFANGHNSDLVVANFGGITYERALEIALGATPRLIDRSRV